MTDPLLYTKNVVFLIRAIKKHKCLWDQQSQKYNDRFLSGLAWKQISEKLRLNISERRLRTKWKYLRDTFNKIERRLRRSDCSYSGHWPLYKELTFLREDNNSSSIEEDSSVSYLESNHDTIAEIEVEVKTECDKNEDVENNMSDTEVNFEEQSIEGDTFGDNEEHDLMFLMSLAPFMEKINPMRKLILRSRIQDMLLNEVASQKEERENRRNAKRRKV